MDEDELRKELEMLYSRYKDIKAYYNMELGSIEDRKKLIDSAKKKITNLYKKRKARSRISKTNTILQDITQISIFDHELVGVYIHYLECASDNIYYYGMRNEAQGKQVYRNFTTAVDLVISSQTQSKNIPKLQSVIRKLTDHYTLWSELSTYYDENLISY